MLFEHAISQHPQRTCSTARTELFTTWPSTFARGRVEIMRMTRGGTLIHLHSTQNKGFPIEVVHRQLPSLGQRQFQTTFFAVCHIDPPLQPAVSLRNKQQEIPYNETGRDQRKIIPTQQRGHPLGAMTRSAPSGRDQPTMDVPMSARCAHAIGRGTQRQTTAVQPSGGVQRLSDRLTGLTGSRDPLTQALQSQTHGLSAKKRSRSCSPPERKGHRPAPDGYE